MREHTVCAVSSYGFEVMLVSSPLRCRLRGPYRNTVA